MKVLDIITESPAGGDPLDMLTVTGIVNAASGTQVQVRRIQQLLSQHKINGQPAWDGPVDGNYTQELDAAIMNWKRSVNRQMGGVVTDTTRPGLTQREVKFLRAPLTPQGLINKIEYRRATQGEGNPFQGQQFQNSIHEKNPTFTRDRTENMRLFIQSIGISGWLAIINEGIETLKDASRETKLRQVRAKMAEVNQNLDSPPRWLNNFARVLEVAKYTNKTVGNQTLVAPSALASGENAPQKLFEYYSRLATFILERDQQIDQAAAAEVQDRVDATGSGLSDARIAMIVQQLKRAFQFSFFKGATDEVTVENIMLELRRNGDFDAISAAYLGDTGELLHRRLARELNDSDYNSIVYNNLLRIQRIMPLPLYRAIRFEDETKIEVEINFGEVTKEAYVDKERDGQKISWGPKTTGSVWLDGDIASIQRDAIIEDLVLRAAIEKTGGTAPENVTVEEGDANYKTSRSVFENELQSNTPEMVAFYTGSDPFEFGARVGNYRAKGIMEQLAILSASGATVEDMSAVAAEEISEDRAILRDTLNVWFDPQYAEEVSSDLSGFRNLDDIDDVDDEDVETLDIHQELAQRFTGTDEEEIQEATREILSDANPAEMWEKVSVASREMQLTDRSEQNSIDMMHDKQAESLSALLDGKEIDNVIYRLMSGGIPIALFPNQVAITLERAMGGNWDTTDEQPIAAILNLLQDRDQFLTVSRAYNRVAGGENLIQKLQREDNELYRQFYSKFNLEEPIQVALVETPFGPYGFEMPNGINRFRFTLTDQTNPSMDYIRNPSFGDQYDPDATSRSAYLGWQSSRWMVFRTPSGGNPIGNGANQDIVEAFLPFLERLGLDEKGEPISE